MVPPETPGIGSAEPIKKPIISRLKKFFQKDFFVEDLLIFLLKVLLVLELVLLNFQYNQKFLRRSKNCCENV